MEPQDGKNNCFLTKWVDENTTMVSDGGHGLMASTKWLNRRDTSFLKVM